MNELLYGTNGQKLYFQNNIVNYKNLYLDIYEKNKIHNKESVVDKSSLEFINTNYRIRIINVHLI